MSNLAVLLSSYVDFQKYSCIMILSKATILVKIPPNAWGFQLPPVFLFQVVDECIIIPCIVLSLKNTRDAQRNVLARYGRRTVLVFIQGEREREIMYSTFLLIDDVGDKSLQLHRIYLLKMPREKGMYRSLDRSR